MGFPRIQHNRKKGVIFMKKILSIIGKEFSVILTALFTLQVANFAASYVFFQSLLSVTVLSYLLFFLVFVLGKDTAIEKTKKYGFFLFRVSTLIFAFSIVNQIILNIGYSIPNTSLIKVKSIFEISYFINIILFFGFFSFYRKESTKNALQLFYDNSILSKLGIRSLADKNKGDVKLCVDKEKKSDVVIPFKDRFLHMLILGPTGSGKTSQIILPMIYQDIQNLEAGMTVIEPKADLAEKVYAMAVHQGRKAVYFNPILPNCPYFNPLHGKEDDVIENLVTTFKMLNPDSPQFFQDHNENLLRNSLKVLKRTKGDNATLIDLHRLIWNPMGEGRKMAMNFAKIKGATAEIAKENSDVAAYFLNDYFNEKSKTYEHCSAVRNQVAKITSNRYLRRVLNPPEGRNDIDFDKHLEEGGVIAFATAQGTLRDLGRFLGYFIILQFQSAVFRRPGNEDTRRAHFLYIDEFQVYANPGFADMLTQGRSYRVASHLATQNRALIGMGRGQEGKDFVELVSTNARNIVIFPGGNAVDAKYYSDQFGEVVKTKINHSVSKARFNPLYGFHKVNYPNESVSTSEQAGARFSPSDIMYHEFGEVTYCIVKNNTVQIPSVGKVEYIPKELNSELDKMIRDYNETVFKRENAGEEEVKEEAHESAVDTDVVIKASITNTSKPRPSESQREYIKDDLEFTDDVVETHEEPVDGDIDFMTEDEDELI